MSSDTSTESRVRAQGRPMAWMRRLTGWMLIATLTAAGLWLSSEAVNLATNGLPGLLAAAGFAGLLLVGIACLWTALLLAYDPADASDAASGAVGEQA